MSIYYNLTIHSRLQIMKQYIIQQQSPNNIDLLFTLSYLIFSYHFCTTYVCFLYTHRRKRKSGWSHTRMVFTTGVNSCLLQAVNIGLSLISSLFKSSWLKSPWFFWCYLCDVWSQLWYFLHLSVWASFLFVTKLTELFFILCNLSCNSWPTLHLTNSPRLQNAEVNEN